MGAHGRPAEEDILCAEYLKATLEGHPTDFDMLREHLRNSQRAAKFFDPDIDWAPEGDFHCCMAPDRFDFVLKLKRDAEWGMVLEKIAEQD